MSDSRIPPRSVPLQTTLEAEKSRLTRIAHEADRSEALARFAEFRQRWEATWRKLLTSIERKEWTQAGEDLHGVGDLVSQLHKFRSDCRKTCVSDLWRIFEDEKGICLPARHAACLLFEACASTNPAELACHLEATAQNPDLRETLAWLPSFRDLLLEPVPVNPFPCDELPFELTPDTPAPSGRESDWRQLDKILSVWNSWSVKSRPVDDEERIDEDPARPDAGQRDEDLDRPTSNTAPAPATSAASAKAPSWNELGASKQTILKVLLKSAEPMQGKGIAIKAGYKEGSLRHHYGDLQKWGLIAKSKDGYTITQEGRHLACERM